MLHSIGNEYKESEVFCGIIVIAELSRTLWPPPPGFMALEVIMKQSHTVTQAFNVSPNTFLHSDIFFKSNH